MTALELVKVFLLVPFFGTLIYAQNQAPIVNTTYGPVSGQQFVSPGGTRVNGYLSVPYADAPIRFGRPTPKQPWTNVRVLCNLFDIIHRNIEYH